MKKMLINDGWYFTLDSDLEAYNLYGFHKYGEAHGAPARSYKYCNWTPVTLPHDWAIALGRDPGANPFAGGYPQTGYHRFYSEENSRSQVIEAVGWYRREFVLDRAMEGKRLFLEFEGIYRDAMLWVNGEYIDRHDSGYTSFAVEITDHLYYGETNSIAVRVDAEQPEGWWYEGAGIYRNVWLHIGEPVYFPLYKTQIRTAVSGAIAVQTVLHNDTDKPVTKDICLSVGNPDRRICATGRLSQTIAAHESAIIKADLTIPSPHLWDINDPYLYELTLTADEETAVTRFGVRSVRMDPDKGFLLNGKPCKIRGACCHQDFGGVGIALSDNLHYYRIATLKQMGVNAYRSAHHAPAPALLNACDELGMLLMDETRTFSTSPEAVRQIQSLIERDFNHPCVFIWSIGNEEFSIQDTPKSRHLAEKITSLVHGTDETRPVIFGSNNGANETGLNPTMEVRGINYIRNGVDGWLEEYHARHPEQPLLGTEESSYVCSRCESRNDLNAGTIDATGLVTMPWGSTPKGWVKFSETRPHFAGSFMWTGFDYRGEPNPFYYTNTISSFGTIDLCGMEKPPFYYYRAWWTNQPVLYAAPHWNFEAGCEAVVSVFTNCQHLTLFLNDRKVAETDVKRFDAPLFRLAFEPGVLTVEGFKDDQTIRYSLETAGAVADLICQPVLMGQSEADASIWEIRAVDANGHLCPTANDLIQADIQNGTIVGIGNGDPASKDAEQVPPRLLTRPLDSFTGNGQAYPIPPKYGNTIQTRYDWFQTETASAGFEDDCRIVARYGFSRQPAREETYTAQFVATADDQFIEFERLGGKTEVYLNGVKIGDNIPEGRISNGNNRPYRFYTAFREGSNEITVVTRRIAEEAPAFSGYVIIGRTVQDPYTVHLYGGRARVFVKSKTPDQIKLQVKRI